MAAAFVPTASTAVIKPQMPFSGKAQFSSSVPTEPLSKVTVRNAASVSSPFRATELAWQ